MTPTPIVGTIVGLSLRAPGEALKNVIHAQAIAGEGLQGDRHALALSPRQLLLASASAYADLQLPPHALRENLLLDIDTARLASGTVLQLGSAATLRLMFQCEACGQLDAARPGLSGRIGARRGMLARVLSGGVIHSGDLVRDLGVLAPAWPDDWRERVRRVLDVVPPGCVVEYKHLARLAGIQSTYCRAFGRLIEKFGPAYAARAVTAQSGSTLPRWEGSGLFDIDALAPT